MDNFLKILKEYYQIVHDKTVEILTPAVKSLQPHLQQHEIFIDDELIIKIIIGMTVFIILFTFGILLFTTRKTKKNIKIEEKIEEKIVETIELPIVIREERVSVEQTSAPRGFTTETVIPQELSNEVELEVKKEPASPQKQAASPQKQAASPQKQAASPQKEVVTKTLDTPGEVDTPDDIPKIVEPSFATVESATVETGSSENKDKVQSPKKKVGRPSKKDIKVEDLPQGSDSGDNAILDDGVDDESNDSDQKRYPARTRSQPDRFTESALVASTPEKKKKIVKGKTPRDDL